MKLKIKMHSNGSHLNASVARSTRRTRETIKNKNLNWSELIHHSVELSSTIIAGSLSACVSVCVWGLEIPAEPTQPAKQHTPYSVIIHLLNNKAHPPNTYLLPLLCNKKKFKSHSEKKDIYARIGVRVREAGSRE